VISKSATGFNIDKNNATTTFLVELKCSSPCEDCTSEALSAECIDCYNTSSFKYRHTVTKQCLSTCPDGYFNDGNSTEFYCTACHTDCLTCTGNLSTNCQSCKTTGKTKYYPTLNTCNTACPSNSTVKTYEDTGVCYDCDPSCQTCSGTLSNNCLTCPSSNYLFGTPNGTCVSDCST